MAAIRRQGFVIRWKILAVIYITYPNEPLAIISIGFGGSGSSGGFLSYRPFAHTLKNSSGIPVEVQICQKVLYKGWPYANLCNKE